MENQHCLKALWLITPQQGQISLCGESVKLALKQHLVAYVPQSEEVDWQFPISVYDVVMQGRYAHMNFLRMAKAADKAAVEQAMARMDITHLKDRQIGELSGGQKKRVFLARALAQQSKIILLDEPLPALMCRRRWRLLICYSSYVKKGV